MKVLFVASEIFPYAKSGGLADVADALPEALKEMTDISRIMPLYGFMDKKEFKKDISFSVEMAGVEYEISVYKDMKDGVWTYFIDAPMLSHTKNLYGDENGDYANNHLRFALFCKAVLEFAIINNVELIHLNDWHTGLVALYIKDRGLDIKTVFTIHNLAYQGVFDFNSLAQIGVSEKYFHIDALEFYLKVNFLKAGIAFSDSVTTVSPSYAKEIQTQKFGCGLDGFLKFHRKKLYGILNGINVKTNKGFDEKTLSKKYKEKSEFIKNSSLKDPRKPLFIMISRLVEQKGIDMILKSSKELLSKRLNLFILGDGNEEISNALFELSKQYDNFEFQRGYDEELSKKLYRSGDFLLMPSLFEPCGLNQMIAMRCATIPIVHSVGGLKDSVFEDESACGSGIVFKSFTKRAFLGAVDRALELKKSKKHFDKVRKKDIECDFSFKKSALKYLEIYKNDLSC